jgi:hypothetical protein
MILDTRVRFDTRARLYDDDPNLGPTTSRQVREAMMGDIAGSADAEVTFAVEALASVPIERMEIRNGLQTLETVRPYADKELGRRIRVIWEGSEYRGRGRQTYWDGSAELSGNRFERLRPINWYNLDKKFEQTAPTQLRWTALTTGGFGGFDAWLADANAGTLAIDTALVKCKMPIAEIGRDDRVFEAGGIKRQIRVFRLPEENPHRTLKLERRIKLRAEADNALYICLTQEDGHLVWSSPIYIFKG